MLLCRVFFLKLRTLTPAAQSCSLGQLIVFPGNRNHAPFMLCLSQQGACFPILLVIQLRILEKTQGVNGKGWCLRAPSRNCYMARRWSLPSFPQKTIAFFFWQVKGQKLICQGRGSVNLRLYLQTSPPSVLHSSLTSPCSRSRARKSRLQQKGNLKQSRPAKKTSRTHAFLRQSRQTDKKPAGKCLPTLGSSLGPAVLKNGNKGKINISI